MACDSVVSSAYLKFTSVFMNKFEIGGSDKLKRETYIISQYNNGGAAAASFGVHHRS